MGERSRAQPRGSATYTALSENDLALIEMLLTARPNAIVRRFRNLTARWPSLRDGRISRWQRILLCRWVWEARVAVLGHERAADLKRALTDEEADR